jgi:hypothetical protein
MMFQNKLRLLITISIIPVILLGVVLILVAVFYQPPQHAVLWYWHDGNVYAYNTENKQTQEIFLPTNGRILGAVLDTPGKQIAFADSEGLKIASLGEDSVRLLIEHETTESPGPSPFRYIYHPYLWSPDGHWLLIHRREFESLDIFLANLEDFSIKQVTLGGRPLCNSNLSWSPDSKTFANGHPGFGPCDLLGGLIVFDPETSNSERLYYERLPLGDPSQPSGYFEGGTGSVAWSPAGNWIALEQTVASDDYDKLVLIKADGNSAQTIVEGWNPVWSPDSKRLYFNAQGGIFVIEISSSVVQNIPETSKQYAASISPDEKWLFSLGNAFYNYQLYGKTGILIQLSTHEITQVADATDTDLRVAFVGWQMVP